MLCIYIVLLFCTERQIYTTAFNKYSSWHYLHCHVLWKNFKPYLIQFYSCYNTQRYCGVRIHLIPWGKTNVTGSSQVLLLWNASTIRQCQEPALTYAEAFWLLLDVAMIFPAPLLRIMGSAQLLSFLQAREHCCPLLEPAVVSAMIC